MKIGNLAWAIKISNSKRKKEEENYRMDAYVNDKQQEQIVGNLPRA